MAALRRAGTVHGMIVEFGGAEVLDLLVVRPSCLAAGYGLAGR